MLSRTADHLFWMARYTERAENTARMLDLNVQTGLLPQTPAAAKRGWCNTLSISELQGAYDVKYPEVTAHDVLNFMVRDTSHASSIASCLRAARENARAVRGTLTTEVWETLNITWLEMQNQLDRVFDSDPGKFFEWVRHRSHLSRGVTFGTMLQDEALYFIRLGTFLERADNTARILDVKFHDAERNADDRPRNHEHQQDFYYWAAILRSVSAFEIYRKVYRDAITPERVADLLMLRSDMPRSLHACLSEVVRNLRAVAVDAGRDTLRFAGKLHAELKFAHIEDILEQGLHAYLTGFLERVYELGNRVSRDFLVPAAE